MKLSVKAWDYSSKIVKAIIAHPFNRELMHGTLERDKFSYYIEQDSLYLEDFARCLAIIASKISPKYSINFLHYSESVYKEQENVHQFFNKFFNFQETKLVTPATLGYSSYLMHICLYELPEIAVAAVLPCFWIYREVGLYIFQRSNNNNSYSKWIETYASEDFCSVVDQVINIFDELANGANDAVRNKMLDAFYQSACLEWHFWNDAYNKATIDNFHEITCENENVQEIGVNRFAICQHLQ